MADEPTEELILDATADELPVYGPYELVPDVNSLSFGSDPVITLEPGDGLLTTEPGIAAFLEEHPLVRKSKGKKGK